MKIQEVSLEYDVIRDDLCVKMTQKLYNTHRTLIEISKSLYTRKINILFYRIKDAYCILYIVVVLSSIVLDCCLVFHMWEPMMQRQNIKKKQQQHVPQLWSNGKSEPSKINDSFK